MTTDDLDAGTQPQCATCGTVMRDVRGGHQCGGCGFFQRLAWAARPNEGDDLLGIRGG